MNPIPVSNAQIFEERYNKNNFNSSKSLHIRYSED